MKKILASILVCLCLFISTGCGGDKLKGTWTNAKDDEYKATFTFNGSGKVTYKNQFIEEKEGNYTIKDDKVTVTGVWDIDMEYKYTLKDGKLTLEATNGYSPSYNELSKK